VAAQVGSKGQTGDVAVDPGLFHQIPAVAQIFFPIRIDGSVKHFGLDSKRLNTFDIIGQQLTLLFAVKPALLQGRAICRQGSPQYPQGSYIS
jgi:hypothetical protein